MLLKAISIIRSLFRQRCDTCGKLATNAARDIVEVFSPNWWRIFEHHGEWRYGCDDHLVASSRTYYLVDPDYPKTEAAD